MLNPPPRLTSRGIALRFGAALLALLVGILLHFTSSATGLSTTVWTWGLAVVGSIVVLRTLREMLAGQFAADIVAAFSIIGAFALEQPFAGLVIVVMQTGGEGLERIAAGRASRAVRDLEAAAPRVAHRKRADSVEEIAVEAIRVGDLLLVRPGEMIPCDATVTEGHSHIDTATLTGEAIPVRAAPGAALLSGALNGESPLTVRATALASESQYSRIVELVRTAQASKAPLQRMADRYAIWFTPVTILACLLTWLLTHDPVRLLAVLVVATPCPLLLAAPVAMIAGLNRAARAHLIIRNGEALEALGTVTSAVFDKTGTLTIGRPHVVNTVVAPGFERNEVLQLAAAVEHGSSHLLARTLVQAAEALGLTPLPADEMVETAGAGITGTVSGRQVTVGALGYVLERHPASGPALLGLSDGTAGLRAYVAIDGAGAGFVEYADAVRPGMHDFLDRLRRLGVSRLILLSGDSAANVDAVAAAVGIDEARGELLPADKVATVQSLTRSGSRTLMVGDGTNDAPALSAATVGVALSAGGSGISAEAASVVILGDDPALVADGIEISRRTMRIAHQSIWGGLGFSAVAMGFAAAGVLSPAVGALVQEAIDVAVILNALRAAR